jgi:predicted DNA-binding transcriptional regulator YafY
MPNTATRLITLTMLLQRRSNQKAHELAKQLGVSVRTVQRHIAMLDKMGIPIYAERGPYRGYSLVRGYKMPPLILRPEEAVAITLGTSLAGEMWEGHRSRSSRRSVVLSGAPAAMGLKKRRLRIEASTSSGIRSACSRAQSSSMITSALSERRCPSARRCSRAYNSSGTLRTCRIGIVLPPRVW